MQTETVVKLPPPLWNPGPGELERKLSSVSAAAPQQKSAPKPVQKPGKPAKQPEPKPESDLLTKLATMEIDKYNCAEVRGLCNHVDAYIQAQGLDKFSAFVIATVQGAIGKLLIQVSYSIDVAQNHEFDIQSDPLNWEVRQKLLPTLEQLTGLFMKVEKDRSSALHARKLGGHGKTVSGEMEFV